VNRTRQGGLHRSILSRVEASWEGGTVQFYVFCVWFVAVQWLFIPAYQDGADQFRALHVAVTDRFPPVVDSGG
jgi:hypothetical protein